MQWNLLSERLIGCVGCVAYKKIYINKAWMLLLVYMAVKRPADIWKTDYWTTAEIDWKSISSVLNNQYKVVKVVHILNVS